MNISSIVYDATKSALIRSKSKTPETLHILAENMHLSAAQATKNMQDKCAELIYATAYNAARLTALKINLK